MTASNYRIGIVTDDCTFTMEYRMSTKQRYPLFKEHEYLSCCGEQFPGIDVKSAHLVFKDEGGKIRAGCSFEEDNFPIFDLGIVPNKISAQSPEAIKKYAKSRVRRMVRKERKCRIEVERRINNLLHRYELIYRGVTIKGYVKTVIDKSSRDRLFVLYMTEPFQVQVELPFRPSCFADGMRGVHSFDTEGNLLPEEIRRKEKELLSLYKKESRNQNKPPKHPALAHLPTFSDPEDE